MLPGTQVYVTVFADGPTRVLRFADVQDAGAEEAEQSILDLAARLRQVEEQLWRINASFSGLHGASGAHQTSVHCTPVRAHQGCISDVSQALGDQAGGDRSARVTQVLVFGVVPGVALSALMHDKQTQAILLINTTLFPCHDVIQADSPGSTSSPYPYGRLPPGVRDLDLYGRANAVPCGQPGSRGDAHPGQNGKSPTPSGASSPNPRLKMKQKVGFRILCRPHHTMH